MNAHPVVTTDYNDFLTKLGVQVELDPARTEALGRRRNGAVRSRRFGSCVDESAMQSGASWYFPTPHASTLRHARPRNRYENAVTAHGTTGRRSTIY